MATRVNLTSLLESAGRQFDQPTKIVRFGENLFADVTGYHLYGELNLALKLTAAEETADAEKLISIFQEYATIGEACAAESQAALLEAQGERIHFFIERPATDADSVAEVLRFCLAFTNAVYDRICKSAGKDFRGFKMATDHGRAILISSGVQANGSIVSLGPAANAPAKEMKRNGVAGHLRMRSTHLAAISNSGGGGGWVNIPMREPGETTRNFISAEMNEKFLNRSDEYVRAAGRPETHVLRDSADYIKNFSGGYVNQPVKVRGFVLRADLDGFSKEVENAFRKGDVAIGALVTRFMNIMKYPEQFRDKFGRTIDLPFAGDCATVILLPQNSGYEDAREFLPVTAAAEWHSLQVGTNSNKQRWADYFGQTKWAVGIAGGDEKEGSNGFIMVAPIVGRHRDFLVAAGWGVGRSLDGQESEGVVGGDTVIPDVDYKALATSHRIDFEVLDSNFWISHGLKASLRRSSGIERLASNPSIYAPQIQRPVPQPRPHYE